MAEWTNGSRQHAAPQKPGRTGRGEITLGPHCAFRIAAGTGLSSFPDGRGWLVPAQVCRLCGGALIGTSHFTVQLRYLQRSCRPGSVLLGDRNHPDRGHTSRLLKADSWRRHRSAQVPAVSVVVPPLCRWIESHTAAPGKRMHCGPPTVHHGGH
ncbi:hypothetical protein SKAU_G00119710 [Synaphobranchus kaupii]|uniref:Uncharacterized protein n=1 Tax=Synaphobranchus kaupii TaxID=118154 RepID=A0A9Q1J2D9_SYNKA|nr:hypothetical protein SKAU_G00119710 [Synaphobranchus kaupii]